MAEVYDALARRAFDAALAAPPGRRYVVGLAGCPGSGKTTTAAAVVARCNALAQSAGLAPDFAALLPMDGFHLYRSQLDAMPDPAEAHRRRGACPRQAVTSLTGALTSPPASRRRRVDVRRRRVRGGGGGGA